MGGLDGANNNADTKLDVDRLSKANNNTDT